VKSFGRDEKKRLLSQATSSRLSTCFLSQSDTTMGGGYVPPHLRGGRGASTSAAARARGRNARASDSGPVGAEAVVAAALSSRDAAERKLSRDGAVAAASTRDALAEVSRAIRSALEDTTKDSQAYWTANPDKRHDAILALAESLSSTASATLVAARVGPLVPSLLAAEAEASRAAVALYNQSVEVFEGVLAMREQYVSEQKANAAAAKRDFGKRPDTHNHNQTAQQALVSLDVATVARASLANALAAIGDVFVCNEAHEHALPVLTRAVTTYERVANEAKRRAENATTAHDRVVAENAASVTIGRHGALAQSVATLAQRRARCSAALLDALWNLADARGKLAECHAARGAFDDAETIRADAFAAFEHAVSHADSAAGDDLGGLVFDFGCVKVAHAQTLLERARVLATQWRSRDAANINNASAAWSLAERDAFATTVVDAFDRAEAAAVAAFEKLKRAAEFSPGDATPHVAAGEAMQTRAEVMRRKHEFVMFLEGSSRSRSEGGTDVPSWSRSIEETVASLVAPLHAAIDPAGGAFGAALRVDSKCFDALVGVAECRVEMGKVFVAVGNDSLSAHKEFKEGWTLYRAALELAGAGGAGNGAHVAGSDPGSPRDRLSFAYAAACAAHLAGESDVCGEILKNVLKCGGCTPSAIAADEDLVGLGPGLWNGGA
jgi:hypothetical protein